MGFAPPSQATDASHSSTSNPTRLHLPHTTHSSSHFTRRHFHCPLPPIPPPAEMDLSSLASSLSSSTKLTKAEKELMDKFRGETRLVACLPLPPSLSPPLPVALCPALAPESMMRLTRPPFPADQLLPSASPPSTRARSIHPRYAPSHASDSSPVPFLDSSSSFPISPFLDS